MASIATANQRARTYRTNGHNETPAPIDPTDRRAVIYVRVSKARDDMSSPDIQRDACERHALAHGWQLVSEPLFDEGESAFMGKAPRPQFRKALELIRTGVANTLIVYKLDRFMRDAYTAVSVKRDIQSWGGSLVSASEGIDTADTGNPMAGVLFSILTSLAEIESQTKSDRIKDWHAGRYNRTGGALPPGGPRPFGYERKRIDAKTTTLIINQAEADIIETAATRILDGEGLKGVAESLSTPERKISRSGLKHILTSETTTGLRFDGTTHHEGNWPAILDRPIWEQLCATLNDPTRLTAGPRGERRHLLAGLITCGMCDAPLYSRTHPKGMRYGCSARSCYNSISCKAADKAILDHLRTNIDVDTWNAMRASGRGNQADVIESFKRKLAVVTDTYLASKGTPDDESEYHRARDIINAQIQNAQDSAPIELPDVDDVMAAWPTMDVDARRLVVNAWFESITLDAYAQGLTPDDRLSFAKRNS